MDTLVKAEFFTVHTVHVSFQDHDPMLLVSKVANLDFTDVQAKRRNTLSSLLHTFCDLQDSINLCWFKCLVIASFAAIYTIILQDGSTNPVLHNLLKSKVARCHQLPYST
jgi:hypothetical protein